MTKAEYAIPVDLLKAAEKAAKRVPLNDPVLVLNWNIAALNIAVAANVQHSRQALINIIHANGGSDPENSDYIFHFTDMASVQRARRQLLTNHLWAFGTTAEMEQLGLVHREPAAESMIVTRITPRTLDYADARFFYL
jgi:hypothetical protein